MNIKTLLVSLMIVLFLVGTTEEMQAQKKVKNYTQAISANPLALAFGVLNVTYEQQIAPTNSFTVFGRYWTFASWTAIGVGGSYRWYIIPDSDNPIEGLSAGPLVAFDYWSYGTETYDASASFAIGGEIAYKFVFDGGFLVEPLAQIAFNILDVEGLTYRPVTIGVNLGYAW